MSSSVATEPEVDTPEPGRRRPRRRKLIGAAGVVLVVAAGVAVVVTDPFGGGKKAASPSAVGTSLAIVRQGPLSSQVNQAGTLSYTGQDDGTPYSVVNRAKGVYTWVPGAGDVIKCGKVLYWVGGGPVPLLCGETPAYRDLSEGDSGKDVRELNDNLVRLGYADRSDIDDDDYYGWATERGVERLQDKLDVDETGSLRLGDAVFLPGPLRIAKAVAKLGTSAMPGSPVAQATSDERQVKVALDASQQAQVKVGDAAQVTLPDNRVTTGKVTRVGTVASAGSDKDGSSGSSTATVPIYITLKNPKDAGRLDQAPVQTQITTAGVKQALIVPVTAPVSQAGGYAVEKVDARGVHTMVPVTLGLFDNADGLVQVTGNLAAGDQVVVPAT